MNGLNQVSGSDAGNANANASHAVRLYVHDASSHRVAHGRPTGTCLIPLADASDASVEGLGRSFVRIAVWLKLDID